MLKPYSTSSYCLPNKNAWVLPMVMVLTWKSSIRPKRVRFLAINASIVDCVCLPLKNLTFLPLMHPLCEFSSRKKERKSAIIEFRFCIDMSQRSTAQHCHIDTPFCTIRKSHVTWNFAVPVPHSEEIRHCILLFLCTLAFMKIVT